MSAATRTESGEGGGWKKALVGIFSIVGLGLVSYGAYTHFSIAGQVRCDGCAPWHPLFVIAPLVIGSALILSTGYLFTRL